MDHDYDYGPLRSYEITWVNRPPEIVQGHQVLFESAGITMFGPPSMRPMFKIHGMFPGDRWRLVLCAPEADMISIRDVTEQLEALEAIAGEPDADHS